MSTTISQSKEITYNIHKAVFLLDKISDQILKVHLGISFSQFLVMMALAKCPKVPQKFVAASLDQTQAAVSRQIDILVGKNLVSRGRNPAAKREYILSLTVLGQKKYQQGFSKINERFDKLFSIWSRTQKSNLLTSLNLLVGEIHAKGMNRICGTDRRKILMGKLTS